MFLENVTTSAFLSNEVRAFLFFREVFDSANSGAFFNIRAFYILFL